MTQENKAVRTSKIKRQIDGKMEAKVPPNVEGKDADNERESAEQEETSD